MQHSTCVSTWRRCSERLVSLAGEDTLADADTRNDALQGVPASDPTGTQHQASFVSHEAVHEAAALSVKFKSKQAQGDK